MNFGTFSEALVSLWSGSIHTGALSREQGPGKSQAWSSASKILVLLDCLYLVSLWSCGYSLAQPEIPVSAIYTSNIFQSGDRALEFSALEINVVSEPDFIVHFIPRCCRQGEG